MVTLAILSAGLVALYRSFFICIDTINHLTYRLHAITLLENRIADVEKKYRQFNHFKFDPGKEKEVVLLNNKEVPFRYSMQVTPVDHVSDVHQIKVTLSWEEGARAYTVSKSAYFSNMVSLNII